MSFTNTHQDHDGKVTLHRMKKIEVIVSVCISALAEHLFRKHSNTQNGFARTPITVSVEQ